MIALATDSTLSTALSTLEQWSLLVGTFLPLVIAVVNRQTWRGAARLAVAAALVLGASAVQVAQFGQRGDRYRHPAGATDHPVRERASALAPAGVRVGAVAHAVIRVLAVQPGHGQVDVHRAASMLAAMRWASSRRSRRSSAVSTSARRPHRRSSSQVR